MARRARETSGAGRQGSFVKGDETVEELRRLVIAAVKKCPLGRANGKCPYRILAGLGFGTMERTVNGLSREQCLGLFEMELECRSSALCEGRQS